MVHLFLQIMVGFGMQIHYKTLQAVNYLLIYEEKLLYGVIVLNYDMEKVESVINNYAFQKLYLL